MFEILIFSGLPLLFLFGSAQAPFFQNWRFLLVLMLSTYLALWSFPLAYELLRAHLPKEAEGYSAAVVLAVSVIVFYIVFFQIASRLSSHGGNGYHLPRGRNITTLVLGFVSGYFVSGLVGYTIAISPLHSRFAASDDFAGKAVHRLAVLTGVIDRFSLQSVPVSRRRSQLLSRITPWQKTKPAPKPAEEKTPPPPEKPLKPVPAPERKKAVKTYKKNKKVYDLSRYDSKPRKSAVPQPEKAAGETAESARLQGEKTAL